MAQTLVNVMRNHIYMVLEAGTSPGTPKTVIADMKDVTIESANGSTFADLLAIIYSSMAPPGLFFAARFAFHLSSKRS